MARLTEVGGRAVVPSDEPLLEPWLREALIRLNRAAEAVPLINATRVENGLPPFPAGATAATTAAETSANTTRRNMSDRFPPDTCFECETASCRSIGASAG